MTLLVAAAGTAAFELLAPGGLAALALLVPLLLLYILKIQRTRREVASTWLWAAAQRDLMARSPFRRLIAQVPLVVQALALIALAMALARPATRGRGFTGDHLAIILDTSASMSALVPGSAPRTTRLDLAKRAAHDLLRGLTPGSDALVLEAASDARLLSPLDRDRGRVGAAVDRAAPRDVEGDLGPAVALAALRLRQLGGVRRVVVITDGNLAHPAAIQGAALPVEVITVGSVVDNAAIVRVDVRSGKGPRGSGGDAPQVQAFLVVANFGRSPRDLYVTMREENASDVLASRRLVVQPGERLPVPLEFQPAPGDRGKGLIFEISPHDAMPVDDLAYGRVPAGDALPVYLAGASPWIERALAADPLVELRTGTVAELAQGHVVDLDTLVVVDGACPDGLPGGDLLVIHPPPGKCLGTTVGPAVERPEITSWENGDPRLRFLTLEGVHVTRANLLQPDGASPRLVNAREGTLITDVSTSARAGTLVGFDPGDSDWPLKASFVLFVRNVIEQARAHRAQGITGQARAGEPLRVNVPPTATHVEAVDPSGQTLEVSQRGGLAILPDVARAGFYRVTWQGPQAGATRIPVNLASAAESDLTPRALASEGNVTVSAAAAPLPHQELTWILALVGLGLVVFDVWYLTRHHDRRGPALAVVARRRVLLAGMIIGALPALYVALTWAGAFSDVYVRLARPWVTLLGLLSTTFIAVRLARVRSAAGPWRIPPGRPPRDGLRVLRGDGRRRARGGSPARSAHRAGRRRPQPVHRSRARSRDADPTRAGGRRGRHAGGRSHRRRRLRCRGRHRGSAPTEIGARLAPARRRRARRHRSRRRDSPRARRDPARLGRPRGPRHGRRGDPRRHPRGRGGGGGRGGPRRRGPAGAARRPRRARGGAARALPRGRGRGHGSARRHLLARAGRGRHPPPPRRRAHRLAQSPGSPPARTSCASARRRRAPAFTATTWR